MLWLNTADHIGPLVFTVVHQRLSRCVCVCLGHTWMLNSTSLTSACLTSTVGRETVGQCRETGGGERRSPSPNTSTRVFINSLTGYYFMILWSPKKKKKKVRKSKTYLLTLCVQLHQVRCWKTRRDFPQRWALTVEAAATFNHLISAVFCIMYIFSEFVT